MTSEKKSSGCGFLRGIVMALPVCVGGAIVCVAHLAANGQDGVNRAPPTAHCPVSGDAEVAKLLQPIQRKHAIPGIAAALVTSDGIVASATAGVRRRDTDVAVTLDDQWHLGSNTKAMTAVLIGRLVERGLLKWGTTMAEVFPEMASEFHADMRQVTVLHLLAHRAGLPANLDLPRYTGDAVVAERMRAVKEYLAQKPQNRPGSKYVYSNLGYIIAGAVVEKVTGKTWEEAMREDVFDPLKMTSVGFGGLGTPGKIDQPWGHGANGQPVPRNGPTVDNPPVMGPAGRVHCTLEDWARFVADQLRGAQGASTILGPATCKALHTPPFGGEYALGWIVTKRAWGGGTVWNHAGSNTMNFANVWVAPKRDFAVIICVNQGGDAAFSATDAAAAALIQLHTRNTRSGGNG